MPASTYLTWDIADEKPNSITGLILMNQYIITGLILLALVGWGSWEHSRFLSERLAYSDFREQSVTQALAQEKQHNDQMSVAMDERDASLARMHDSQKRTNTLSASLATALSRGTCQDSATDHAALSRFFADVEEYIIEADTAVINVKAWASAWPE